MEVEADIFKHSIKNFVLVFKFSVYGYFCGSGQPLFDVRRLPVQVDAIMDIIDEDDAFAF